MENSDITIFAETTFRNERRKFGIKQDDRRRHMYLIGKTGMGKTVMLENMVIQDIRRGYGVAVVDPHGEFAERMLDFVPSSRINDVIYFNPADFSHPIAFNVLERVDPEYRHLVASGLMGIFKKIWPDVWSARMEYLLNNSFLSLLEYPGSTLLGVNRIFADKEYRKKVVDKITNSSVKSFWVNEFAKYPDRFREEAVAPIQNKVGQFIAVPLIRNIVGQTNSAVDMREVMDQGRILIVNLSKGKIGEDNSALLGAMIITKLQLAAMSRVDIPENERNDFYLYVDEFQNFATESFANILSEARKYRLDLILAHQYITQMEEKVRDAVFGNVGTMTAFRVGAADAEFLEREFTPEFSANDLVNLTKYNIYLKLMIDGVSSNSFSAETLPPFPLPDESHREKIIKVSRERYGTPRERVEEKVSKWWGVVAQELKEQESSSPSSSTLYDAVCSKCGKATKVVFEPDGKRPVYCKKCRRDFPARPARMEREAPPPFSSPDRRYGDNEQKISSEETRITEQVPFSPKPVSVVPRRNERYNRTSEEFSSSSPTVKPRRPVDLDDLRKTLEDALGKAKEETKEHESENEGEANKTGDSEPGVLREGESVRLSE